MPVEFHQTVLGHRFYEGTMPSIAKNLEALTRAVVDLTKLLREIKQEEIRTTRGEAALEEIRNLVGVPTLENIIPK